MLEKLKHINLLEPRVVTGVEVRVQTSSEVSFFYTQIKNYYGTITVKKQNENEIDLENLVKEVGKNKLIPFSSNPPIVLTFTGKQVIIKKIEDQTIDLEDDSSLLQRVLPGARVNDVYIQTFESGEGVFVAVVKRNIVDQVLSQLKENGFYIQEVILGPFAVLSFKEQLNRSNQIQLPGYQIQFDNDSSLRIINSENIIGANTIIGEEELSFNNIISFSGAFAFFSGFQGFNTIKVQSLQAEQTEIKFGIYQMALLKLFLFLMFFIGLTNYFLGVNYTNAYEELQEATSEQKQIYLTYQTKEQELLNRINLLKNTGVYSIGSLSYYADRIGGLIPKSIKLLEMKIAPILKKIKKDERVEISPNKLLIKGVAPVSLDLNEWVLKLNNEEWIQETIIVNYSQTDRENPGIFNLEISLNG